MLLSSVQIHGPASRLLALLCSTALAGALLLYIVQTGPAQAQVLYGATGGEGFDLGGDGGDAGQAGADGGGADPGAGGEAGTASSPNGGDGGDGGGDFMGAGGGGGGYSNVLSGDILSPVDGGHGGAGGGDRFERDNGGGGGGGDAVLNTDANPSISIAADIRGGDGGDDGSGGFDYGGGGGGGAGLVLQNNGAATVESAATVFGGNGGNGGTSGGILGGGGGGGAGAVMNAGGTFANHGTVGGGDGGMRATGGAGVVFGGFGHVTNNGSIVGGTGQFTGPGGAGIDLQAGGSVINTGEIVGGAGDDYTSGGINYPSGGTGSGGAPGFVRNNPSRAYGGTGIIGAGVSIINSGTIAGGIGFAVQAEAISLSGSGNRLELRDGSVIVGDVVITGGGTGNIFALGGDADSSFDASSIGVQYQGFTGFEKTGDSTWTLTGTGAQDWSIVDGALVGDTDSFGGNLNFVSGTRIVFDQATDGTYAATISGDGSLSKIGAGQLALTSNNQVGFFHVHDGTLLVDGGTLDQPDYALSGRNYIGQAAGDDASLVITNGGTVSAADTIAIGGLADSQGSVTVSGNGSSLNADFLSMVVGDAGEGSLSVTGNGYAFANALYVGGGSPGSLGTGIFSVSGAGSSADVNALYIATYGNGSTGAVTLSDGGTLGAPSVIFMGTGNTAGAADLNIGSDSTDSADAAAPGTLTAREIRIFEDSASLNFNHTGGAYVFDTPLMSVNDGAGFINHYAGTTTLTGDSADFSGDTIVHGGALTVNGRLGGTVTVNEGATLGGSGTVGTTTVADRGILAPGGSIGTLTVDGNLSLSSGSILDYELGSPGTDADAPGTSDRIDVTGDLALNGTLNLSQSGDSADGTASLGYYRLMTYGGDLSGDGLTIDGTPDLTDPADYEIQAGDGNVDLFVQTAGDDTLQHWQGGDGTWNGTNQQWLNQGSDILVPWAGNHAVFKNNPGGFDGGTITVEGAQSFKGLQFVDSGYRLEGPGSLVADGSDSADGNAEIRVLGGETAEIAAAITGTGGITKTQGGTLVLEGTNTYQGGTAVSGGTLSVSSDANLGAASGGLSFDGGTLQNTAAFSTARNVSLNAGGGTFQTNADLTESGVVSGIGSLTKVGDGILTLSGTNTYTGGTVISHGEVHATVIGALGTGPVVNQASLSFVDTATAGALQITNQHRVIFRDESSAGDATIVNNAGGAVEIADLTADGIAVGSLSGDGTVYLGSKTLTLGGLGKNDTVGGIIADGGSSGGGGTGGSLVKIGAGTLTLTGANIYSGGTMVNAGTLQLGDGGTSGVIAGGVEIASVGTLAFNRKDSVSFAGALTGSGALDKLGAGTLELTGDSAAFTGTTTIDAGTLAVNGMLGGVLEVMTGGRLQGAGTVGTTTIANGATIAPGNSIGTLTVDGDITFAVGSFYEAEINPALDSDLIDASGAATIYGGTVHALKAAGVYTPGSRWTIIGADGGVTGTFDNLTQNMPFVDLALAYDPSNVYIDATRNEVALCDVAKTFNQCSTGDGLETTGAGSPVYDAVSALADEDSARQALDALSGEIHALASSALIEDSRFVRSAANDRIRAAFATPGASYAPVLAYGPGETPVLVSADHAGPVFWLHGFGSWGSIDSDGNAASFDHSTGGLLLGADGLVGNWRVGLLAGYSHSSFKADDRASSGSSSNYHFGLYGGTEWGNVAVRSGLAYTWHDVETNRSVSIPGLSDSLTSDYDAETFQAFGEIGYGVDLGAGTRFEPFVNLAHVSLHSDGFTEHGGAAGLSVEGSTSDVTFTTLGVRGEHNLTLGTVNATMRGMIGWRHAFGDDMPDSTHAFSVGGAFTVVGVPIAKNSAVIEAGIDFNLTPDATFGLSYIGQLATDSHDHGVKANLAVNF